MENNFLQRHKVFQDAIGIVIFVIFVLVGVLLINSFVFRSFNVLGPSMEKTLFTGDHLIVNRLPVTLAQLQNKPYSPKRGQVIVFKNPQYVPGGSDEYIVKRVIAFSGERVTVKDGVLTIYTDTYPDGIEPDEKLFGGAPGEPTSGDVDTVVAQDTLFVSGDHRQGDFSYDSRSGLGLIPLYDVIGPVGLRIYPLTQIRTF